MRIGRNPYALPNAKIKIDERWVALRESTYYKYGILSYAIWVGPDIYGSNNIEVVALLNDNSTPTVLEVNPFYIAPTTIIREWVRAIYGPEKVNEMRRVAEQRRNERVREMQQGLHDV